MLPIEDPLDEVARPQPSCASTNTSIAAYEAREEEHYGDNSDEDEDHGKLDDELERFLRSRVKAKRRL